MIQADDLVLPEFQICVINATTSTNIRCLSGNTYSFRLRIMPIWSYRFCILAYTSSHHLHIYLWVEKLYYHAVAHSFTIPFEKLFPITHLYNQNRGSETALWHFCSCSI